MRRLLDTSFSLLIGLAAIQASGAGCAPRVSEGDEDSAGQALGTGGSSSAVSVVSSGPYDVGTGGPCDGTGGSYGTGWGVVTGGPYHTGTGGDAGTGYDPSGTGGDAGTGYGPSGAGGDAGTGYGTGYGPSGSGYGTGYGSGYGSGYGTGGSEPGQGTGSAIALLRSQFPTSSSGSGSGSTTVSTGTGGGPDLDSNDLFIVLGEPARSCSAPHGFIGCDNWKVSIGIPPELQEPGVISLSDPRLLSSFTVNGPDEGGGNCSFGGGTFWNGTIEIVRIDAAEVVFSLSGTPTYDFNANGEYTADRCP